MVAPLLEALLLRVLRRGVAETGPVRPTRLVSAAHRVDTAGYVAERTTVLLQRDGADPEVLPAGSLVLPSLLPGAGASYAVLTHEPVDVRLRLGPFDTLDGRTVHQVELRVGLALTSSGAGLRDLVEADARLRDAAGHGSSGPDALDGLGDRLLDRLAREVSGRITDAVRRRTLDDLTSLSLGVVLDESLPTVFLTGAIERSALEVVDVDWPTEGRGRPRAVAPPPGDTLPLRAGVSPSPLERGPASR